MKKEAVIPFCALFGIWIIAIIIVNPVGDFPLNDDFSYGRTVFNWVVKGELIFDQWLSMTLIAQVLWGAGFCKIFGFSFTVLRLSTLVLGFLGITSTYLIFRELGQKRNFSLFLALLIGFNPFFFSLSNTFMTDVPFFSFSVLSVLFYLKAFNTKAIKWVIWGTIMALVSIHVRQLGLMLPFSFGVAWFWQNKRSRESLIISLAPVIISLIAFLLYSYWLSNFHTMPDGYGDFQKLFKRIGQPGFFHESFRRLGILVFYLGMFFLPVLPFLSLNPFNRIRFLTGVLIFFIVGAFFLAWPKIPWGNVLYNLGLGPKVLKDTYFSINKRPEASLIIVYAVKIIGFLASIILVFQLKERLKSALLDRFKNKAPLIFALSNIVLYSGFLFLDIHFFDRYYFQLLPFLGIFLFYGHQVSGFENIRLKILSIFTLSCVALFSITATHDYLSWNRARWKELHKMVNVQGISTGLIDGGFEFNGWYRPGKRDYESGKSWWWVDKDDYVVSFGDYPGFKKVKSIPFKRYLPPAQDSIFILKRE